MPVFRDIDGGLWSVERAEDPGPGITPPMPPPPPRTGRLRVAGTGFVDGAGVAWVGRGVNLMDTRGCNACTWGDPSAEEVIRRLQYFVDQGATFFRLCLESYAEASGRRHWSHDAPDYLDDVERIVAAANALGVQMLVSLWIDDTFDAGWVPTAATYPRLRELGRRLEKYPTAWIGCCNEPTQNWNGLQDAERLRVFTECVAAIRSGGFSGLVTVQGLGGWGRYMDYYIANRIPDAQVVYETHIYGPSTDYETQVTEPRAGGLPVLLGEFGPVAGMMTQPAAVNVYRQATADGVTNAAWVGHHRCGGESSMLVDHSNGGCGIGMPLELTAWGAALQGMWTE